MQINLDEILHFLESSNIVSQITEVIIDETASRCFYKIRCNLTPSDYKFQIKLINLPDDFLYSYQVYTHTPKIRWDNSPHFPDISTFPHHFHNSDEKVKISLLKGENLIDDLQIILANISVFLTGELLK